jgi:hypothetical protein
MNRHTARKTGSALMAAIAVVTVSAFSQLAYADDDNRARRNIEGVWFVTTTPRNCATGMPITPATFEGLFTFHRDGTMSVWVQNAAITVTRSQSHGLWQRDLGRGNYAFKFVHLHYDGSGFFSGKQDASGTLALNRNGDEFTTDSSTTFFDASGNATGMGCANAVGKRYDWDE